MITKNRKVYPSSLEEMNKYLEQASKCSNIRFYEGETHQTYNDGYQYSLTCSSYIKETLRYVYLTTKYADDFKPTTYIFDKIAPGTAKIDGTATYLIFTHYGKIRNIVEEMPNLFHYVNKNGRMKVANSSKALLGSIGRYEGKVYGYDLNSAYSRVLYDKIIDTYSMQVDTTGNLKVKENQVGFLLDTDLTMITKVGRVADVVFDLIDSPYKKFITKYFKEKKLAKLQGDNDRKERAKQILNFPIGFTQNINPFFRAYIIHTCNNYIEQFLKKYKKNIVLWNTDAVYSNVRIPEIEENLGEDLGQWKPEFEGTIRVKGLNYQEVETNKVTYRGVIKQAFEEKKDYNLLKDELPKYSSNIELYNYKDNEDTIYQLREVNKNE